MNERIQELLSKATDTVEITNTNTGITHHREFVDQEKFAQLIIDDCLALCEQGANTQTTSQGVATMIKLHFGIKND